MSFTPRHLYFTDLTLGQQWTSAGRTVTESDIVAFAGLSGDFNAIHVDHQFAATTPFRRPIAHGLLVMAIASGLSYTDPPMRTIAFLGIRDWKMLRPVFPGDTIRVVSTVAGLEPRGRGKRGEVLWHRTIINQDGEAVQEGHLLTLVEARPGPRTTEVLPPSPPALRGGGAGGEGADAVLE